MRVFNRRVVRICCEGYAITNFTVSEWEDDYRSNRVSTMVMYGDRVSIDNKHRVYIRRADGRVIVVGEYGLCTNLLHITSLLKRR